MIAFGPFQLFPAERRLLRGEIPIRIGTRPLEILIVLVERAGEIVGKRDLLARVWPGLAVDETTLRVQIAALRKALADRVACARYVTNVPGRGYSFIAPIVRAAASPGDFETGAETPTRLPPRLNRMIGRDETVAAICRDLLNRRFVNIVGAGGMGKTTVASAAAHVLLREFVGAVQFIDFSSIIDSMTDPQLLAGVVAAALGVATAETDAIQALLGFLAQRRMLIVLDNCEHVIEQVAALAERIHLEAPRVYLLATSRESLRVEGEYVHKLEPLAVPDNDVELTANAALGFPAVQLFMERAAAAGNQVALNDADARVVAHICRRLDGSALALELAAARVSALGIRGTADLLERRFGLLWQGRRTALARHHSLNAMLDWSFRLLTQEEQQLLCRLSVFVRTFTLEAAQLVAADAHMSAEQVVEGVSSLVGKSLIFAESGTVSPRYRLLNVTRAYASVKLAESGEAVAVARRYEMVSTHDRLPDG